MKKKFQYSNGIYVHERPGAAVLINEIELGIASPARISRYIKWGESGDVFKHRAAEMIVPFCHGRGIIKKLVQLLESNNVIIRRFAASGLMHQPANKGLHEIIGESIIKDPDSIVQFRLIQALAKHGTEEEIPMLKEFSEKPPPPTPPDLC